MKGVLYLRVLTLTAGFFCHVSAVQEIVRAVTVTAPSYTTVYQSGQVLGNASKSYIQDICTAVLQKFVQGPEFSEEMTETIEVWKKKKGACFQQEGYLARYDEDLQTCRSCDRERECMEGEACAADCTVSLEVRKLWNSVIEASKRGEVANADIADLKERLCILEHDQAFQQGLSIAAISASMTCLLVVITALSIYHACTVSRMQKRLDELNAVRNTYDILARNPTVEANDEEPLIVP